MERVTTVLTTIRHVLGEFFVFQRNGAPARRACDTTSLLECETTTFIWPDSCSPNISHLNPVDYNNYLVCNAAAHLADKSPVGGRLEAVSD